MIAQLLPTEVVAVDATLDPPEATLFPEEAEQIRNAVEKRRLEFTTARWCARRALAGLGLPAMPILPGLRGAPQWAPDVVGSMTHCNGYRAAAVARTSDMAAIGIDAEPNDTLPEGILESIALPQERGWVRQLMRTTPEVCWDRLLFSMKESVYKAWFPLTGRELDFEDALITVNPLARTFRARLLLPASALKEGDPTGFSGRWSAGGGVLVSAIAVPATVPATVGAQQNAPYQMLVGSAA
ncbi:MULTISPECIES: 4'-phosphopantetheinyl transferase family protein [unclassified Streptomyces]|uniref:4'-phosphopantetheinyl transferase family protein n=1 Tax=unclassified Streptomyces TaxID=2593676 RepID=UPI002033391D|nr:MULTISPECIES: 4'-phosphopantetheinyl transferase superfamily protein [unclassified Streptomyces]MCM2421608.1 4'-phosphopantetheinyl transferase superfamily protein [Streptomyces sp. RKAG293]MCM2426189.1 4'-phosphopantetheinyl transferase superfamily protein [Streptomyces sp. RKAG337]